MTHTGAVPSPVLWEGPHSGEREKSEEEGAAATAPAWLVLPGRKQRTWE